MAGSLTHWLLLSVTDTASVVEIMWSAITGCGVLVHMYAYWDARSDLKAIDAVGENGRLRYAAHGDMIEEGARMFKQGLLFSAGISTAMRPPSVQASQALREGAATTILLLIGAALMMVGVSVFKIYRRKKLRGYNRVAQPVNFMQIVEVEREVDGEESGGR